MDGSLPMSASRVNDDESSSIRSWIAAEELCRGFAFRVFVNVNYYPFYLDWKVERTRINGREPKREEGKTIEFTNGNEENPC